MTSYSFDTISYITSSDKIFLITQIGLSHSLVLPNTCKYMFLHPLTACLFDHNKLHSSPVFSIKKHRLFLFYFKIRQKKNILIFFHVIAKAHSLVKRRLILNFYSIWLMIFSPMRLKLHDGWVYIFSPYMS